MSMSASGRRDPDTVLPSASAIMTALGQAGGTLDAWLLREENHAPLNGGGFVNRDHELGALRRVVPLREVRLRSVSRGHANRVLFKLIPRAGCCVIFKIVL